MDKASLAHSLFMHANNLDKLAPVVRETTDTWSLRKKQEELTAVYLEALANDLRTIATELVGL